jgi:hypothetical protein
MVNCHATAYMNKSEKETIEITFNKELGQVLLKFLRYHPAHRLSKNLRGIFLEFLMSNNASQSKHLNDLLPDLEALFELLDAIEKDWADVYD